jgi:GrpB-like predicted nucleotidyltransferase (UPF0157 family)
MIGLDHSKVELAPYSAKWIELFAAEQESLQSALGDLVLEIQHIGSTAIPGMAAKPIIDIAATIPNIDEIEKCVQPLEGVGYEHKGEYGLPGRHFFIKGKPSTHHLHIVEKGSHHWDLWLLFRDYLIEHDVPADKYSEMKQRLADKFASDRSAYTANKGDFIRKVLEEAAG